MKGFNKIGGRWDQFTKATIAIWGKKTGGGEFGEDPYFVIEVNGKTSFDLSLGELKSLKDCLTQDIDLTKPMGMF